jgi:hypothetical protein
MAATSQRWNNYEVSGRATSLVWVAVAVLGVAVVDAMAMGAWLLLRAPTAKAVVYSPSAHPTSPWRGTSTPRVEEEEVDESPKLPAIKRSVPVFDLRLLDGCSKTDLDVVETGINEAISVGAPLYNQGDFDGCYRTYDSAALSVERSTAKTCKGPAGVLKTGRERAAKLGTSAAQAWAMRDAFDGLLDVIERKGPDL